MRLSILWVGWPGLAIVSGYAITRAVGFYRSLRHSAPGLLVLLTITGWILTLAGVAFVTTLYMSQDPEQAGPVTIPVFVLWAGSMVTIVWVVHRWGKETATLDTYYGEIERMDRMKSGFINHVAHELNTPMTPLRMQVAVLKSQSIGPLTEKQVVAVQRMDRNLDRLSNLVDQVLMASFIQSGRMKLERGLEDVVDIARRAAEATATADKPIEVESSGAIEAHVDRRRLGYAVQTLLSHLLGIHQGEKPVRVEVMTDSDWVDLDISYDGDPLDARAFEAFGDPAAAATQEGIAIGLYNVHGIIGMHDGRIQTPTGSRSHVRIRVPVGTADAPVPGMMIRTA